MENWFVLGALLALLGSSGCSVATMRGAARSQLTQEIQKEKIGEAADGAFGVLYADFTYIDFEGKRQRGRLLQTYADVWTSRHVSGELIFELSHSILSAQIRGAGTFSGARVVTQGKGIRVLPDSSMLERRSGAACLDLSLSNGVRLRWTIQYAAGDFNHDEIVDDADARDLMWALGGQSVTSEYHATFDLRADGRIDQNDFNLFTAAYNQVIPDFSGGCLE